jgi:adenosylcobinamide-GDP ribazoletransferase
MFPVAVAAVLAVTADLVLTGLLHLDGLCDAADGLLPPMTRTRRLEVMASSDVGAFGSGVCALVLLTRVLCFASLRPTALLPMALWAASRAYMALVMTRVPYARGPGGLASAFVEQATATVAVTSLVAIGASVALATTWRPLAGSAAVVAALLAAVATTTLAWRRIGGFTGDVLGAAGTVGETVGLVVACAKW